MNNDTNVFITDGTPRGVPYGRYLDCTWVIRAPEDAEGITLDFSYFQTYEGWDYLKIYASDQADTSALVSSLSGNGEQNGTFSVSTDKHVMLLQFQSNYFGFRADGFGATVNILCTYFAFESVFLFVIFVIFEAYLLRPSAINMAEVQRPRIDRVRCPRRTLDGPHNGRWPSDHLPLSQDFRAHLSCQF